MVSILSKLAEGLRMGVDSLVNNAPKFGTDVAKNAPRMKPTNIAGETARVSDID